MTTKTLKVFYWMNFFFCALLLIANFLTWDFYYNGASDKPETINEIFTTLTFAIVPSFYLASAILLLALTIRPNFGKWNWLIVATSVFNLLIVFLPMLSQLYNFMNKGKFDDLERAIKFFDIITWATACLYTVNCTLMVSTYILVRIDNTKK